MEIINNNNNTSKEISTDSYSSLKCLIEELAAGYNVANNNIELISNLLYSLISVLILKNVVTLKEIENEINVLLNNRKKDTVGNNINNTNYYN